MKKGLFILLKIIILVIAIGVLLGLIWFPQTEGRAVNLDLLRIYSDPFIIYIYFGSIPFFVVLYQVFKLLHIVEANKIFSKGAVTILKKVKLASLSLIGFITVALLYIRFFVQGEDPAGPTALGFLVSVLFGATAVAVNVFQKRLQKAIA